MPTKAKFVISYTAKDEFSSTDVVECVEYCSEMALRAAFKRFITRAFRQNLPPWEAKFCGIEWVAEHFFERPRTNIRSAQPVYKPPIIRPLDRWFRLKLAENAAA